MYTNTYVYRYKYMCICILLICIHIHGHVARQVRGQSAIQDELSDLAFGDQAASQTYRCIKTHNNRLHVLCLLTFFT